MRRTLSGGQRHGLGCEDVAHLTGANPECDCTECSVGCGVGVPAGDGHTGLGDALLGSNDVHDALLAGAAIEESDTVVSTVFAQFLDHRVRERIGEWLRDFIGRNDVVDKSRKCAQGT